MWKHEERFEFGLRSQREDAIEAAGEIKFNLGPTTALRIWQVISYPCEYFEHGLAVIKYTTLYTSGV
jgi:hypothetical protein